jgi:double-stranded uracil-DNA glycosylase
MANPKHVLPDYLEPGLRIVFCGTAVARTSAQRAHYYSGPGNKFWSYLHESGLTPTTLAPEEDARVVEFGLGLTDLAKKVAASSDRNIAGKCDVPDFVKRVKKYRPQWIAFHGKTAAGIVASELGHRRKLRLGVQPWSIGSSGVFVLPNASASNQDPEQREGRASRADWFSDLAKLLDSK